MRIVHADAAHLLEETAPGLPPLARRIGIRGRTSAEASAELLAQYAEVTERIRAAYEDIVVRAAAQATSTPSA
jgi:glutamate-ammonia-ligase adenylyltransferase